MDEMKNHKMDKDAMAEAEALLDSIAELMAEFVIVEDQNFKRGRLGISKEAGDAMLYAMNEANEQVIKARALFIKDAYPRVPDEIEELLTGFIAMVPFWTKWLAIDGNGEIWAFENRPVENTVDQCFDIDVSAPGQCEPISAVVIPDISPNKNRAFLMYVEDMVA